jgi:hypothetical protein
MHKHRNGTSLNQIVYARALILRTWKVAIKALMKLWKLGFTMSSSRSPKKHKPRMVKTTMNVKRRSDTEVNEAILFVKTLPTIFKPSKCLHFTGPGDQCSGRCVQRKCLFVNAATPMRTATYHAKRFSTPLCNHVFQHNAWKKPPCKLYTWCIHDCIAVPITCTLNIFQATLCLADHTVLLPMCFWFVIFKDHGWGVSTLHRKVDLPQTRGRTVCL